MCNVCAYDSGEHDVDVRADVGNDSSDVCVCVGDANVVRCNFVVSGESVCVCECGDDDGECVTVVER